MLDSTTFSTLIIIKTVFLEKHIVIISEVSCDSEDWNHDAENSALSSQE